MLPLIVKGKNFVKQFTLVYSDWTVLRSDNQEKNKGIPCIDKCLFGELLGKQGVRRDQIFYINIRAQTQNSIALKVAIEQLELNIV